jgi:hypothetical protein
MSDCSYAKLFGSCQSFKAFSSHHYHMHSMVEPHNVIHRAALIAFQQVNSEGIMVSSPEITALAVSFPAKPWYKRPLAPRPPTSQKAQLLLSPIMSFKEPSRGKDPLAVSGGMALIPALART